MRTLAGLNDVERRARQKQPPFYKPKGIRKLEIPARNQSLTSLQDLIEQGSQGSVISIDSLPQSMRAPVKLPPLGGEFSSLFDKEMTLSDYIAKGRGLRPTHQKRKVFNTISGSSRTLKIPVIFKPYSLEDYRKIKPQKYTLLGGLGPVTIGRQDWLEKAEKRTRAHQYAESVRIQRKKRSLHALLKKED